jgi:heme exporter protein C
MKILAGLAVAAGLLLVRNVYSMLDDLPDEAAQGAIYRLIFFHVPAAWTSLLCCFGAVGFGLAYLRSSRLKYDSLSAACIEAGLVFGLTNIFTGMIWGSIIWGVAWTWDARLTSMFLLQLLYAGYLMLRQAIHDPAQRARGSAFMAVFAAADVPIIWFSIKWWRTQHPQPVFWDKGSIDPAMANMNYLNLLPILALAVVLIAVRARQLETSREVEQFKRAAYAY